MLNLSHPFINCLQSIERSLVSYVYQSLSTFQAAEGCSIHLSIKATALQPIGVVARARITVPIQYHLLPPLAQMRDKPPMLIKLRHINPSRYIRTDAPRRLAGTSHRETSHPETPGRPLAHPTGEETRRVFRTQPHCRNPVPLPT
jgi:hypothetical protein